MIHNLDALDFLSQIETDSVNLAFLDPPYNIGIFCKMPEDEYLTWCKSWLVEVDRVLVANGALWICHKDPGVLVDLSRMVDRLGRERKNWVTWDKWNDLRFRWDRGEKLYAPFGALWKHICKAQNRSFGWAAEYLVWHADEGEWTAQCDKERGFIFEPLRAYLDGEIKRSGIDINEMPRILGYKSGKWIVEHYINSSQWRMPTRKHYASLQQGLSATGEKYLARSYESLKAEYESLRAEYESLRYTFNNPGRLSSVWQIPPATNSPHPTPKPELLLETIIKATSNPGDLVLDPFCGSGTTAYVAQYLDRRFVVNDHDEKWCEYTRERLRVKRLL